MGTVGIIGLGVVGKELVNRATSSGFKVHAIDVDEEVVKAANAGTLDGLDISPRDRFHASVDAQEIVPDMDTILVCVPTPLNEYHADLTYLTAAFREIADSLSEDTLISIESTIPPGTTKDLAEETSQSNGLTVGEDYYLIHCPERIDPGNEEWPLESVPRVIGGVGDESTRRGIEFYSEILASELHPVTNPETAACAKVVENAFRDINIAFVNELARALNTSKMNVQEVLDAAETKPYGFMRFSPGPGVGGHCIPVDPYMLIHNNETKYRHEFLQLSRQINDRMPEFVVRDIQDLLNAAGKSIKGTSITLLGLSFKSNIRDIRRSPALEIKDHLERLEGEVQVYDPYLPEMSDIHTPYGDSDVKIILTDHDEFHDLDYRRLASGSTAALYDSRGLIEENILERLNIEYKVLGGRSSYAH